jgi:threonine dehydrogenase-like Zn-dependent dehydrogenase
MRALTYHGPFDIRVDTIADPRPFDSEGAVVAIRACGICGSDLHIYEGHGFSSDLGYRGFASATRSW